MRLAPFADLRALVESCRLTQAILRGNERPEVLQ
jgi:hypothetical protein